ncbi:MAG TPA: N-acetyl-gamma-glutamyl-phosphate reductase [Acidimicrobiales bacterium]|jgi:N-acetyl-gamma-glutamyl-phosphate reductase|nr:N-acetyl-gamma-glutamyl-phosphate reductase [Acidimicrobiales bacterium]
MRVGVAGASGYVGTELLRCLAAHRGFEVAVVTAERHVGERLADHAPSLAAAYGPLVLSPGTPEALSGCELVFVALPHGRSAPLVGALRAAGSIVVDLGADLRLRDAAAWTTWYGETHPAPELVGTAVYGLVERHRDELKGARTVAVPGCYPTATVLALGPLVDGGLLGAGPVAVSALSGASGAGAALREDLHFPALADDAHAYGLLTHRHTAEMEQELGRTVLFTPHLVPMDRGLLATCAAPAAPGVDTAGALSALHDAYDHEAFVVVTEDPPRPKAVRGTNVAHVTARVDPRTGWLLALCAIDNLGKGAAGQAIQCANVVCGLDEGEGLSLAGVWP